MYCTYCSAVNLQYNPQWFVNCFILLSTGTALQFRVPNNHVCAHRLASNRPPMCVFVLKSGESRERISFAVNLVPLTSFVVEHRADSSKSQLRKQRKGKSAFQRDHV